MRINIEQINKWAKGLRDGNIKSIRLVTPKTIKALCYILANTNVIYTVKNWPGGVKEVTCDLDTCPMCKRKL